VSTAASIVASVVPPADTTAAKYAVASASPDGIEGVGVGVTVGVTVILGVGVGLGAVPTVKVQVLGIEGMSIV
jgi:hypothetical protein